jgi:hypothetical protein
MCHVGTRLFGLLLVVLQIPTSLLRRLKMRWRSQAKRLALLLLVTVVAASAAHGAFRAPLSSQRQIFRCRWLTAGTPFPPAAAGEKKEDDEIVSIHAQRTLSADGALYDHNFPVAVPTKCYRSSYFSPYRLFALNVNKDVPAGGTTFSFNVEVAACPYPDAVCCTQNFDHLLIKLGEPNQARAVCEHAMQRACHAASHHCRACMPTRMQILCMDAIQCNTPSPWPM